MPRLRIIVLVALTTPASALGGQLAALPILSDGNGVTLQIMGRETGPGGSAAGRSSGVVYDSIAGERTDQTPTTGPGGSITEGFVSTITSASTLRTFMFAGGVEVADTVVYFNFYNTGGFFVDGFGVRLDTPGFDIVWSITLDDPTLVEVPAAGSLALFADSGANNNGLGPTNAAWTFNDVAPAIGSTSGDVYRMKIDVIPGPGVLGVCGLAGLGAVRRRREGR